MLTYLGQRTFILVPTLLVISALVFGIIQLPSGNFLDTLISEMSSRGDVDVEKVKFLIEQHHLDEPIPVQYGYWLLRAFQGDFGYSFEYNQPVAAIIGDRLLFTFLVTLVTVFFTYLIAFPIGIYSATRQYSWGDYGLTFLGFLGLATPNFLLALVLLYLSNRYFGISIGGLMEPEFVDQPWSVDKMVSVLQHLIVPTLVIGTAGTAGMIRRLRANLLDELQKQYVVTGRAKGLPPMKLLVKYPLRMSLNPFISDIGDLLPELVSGSVIVSVVMSLPTTGPMLVAALRSQDIFLAQSFLMFLALLTVIGIFLSDLALAALDPRIRLQGGATK